MKLEKEIYSVKEVAKLIDMNPETVRAAIRTGTLKANKFNNSYVIHREALADYLDYRERRDNGK